jgi:hypothetical protein
VVVVGNLLKDGDSLLERAAEPFPQRGWRAAGTTPVAGHAATVYGATVRLRHERR